MSTPAPGGVGVQASTEHVSLSRLLIRHWRVTMPIILATVVACLLVQAMTPPVYRSVGSLMVAAPNQDPSRVARSINQLRAALEQLQSDEVRGQVIAGDSSLDAQLTDRTTLTITAAADVASEAERTVAGAIRWLGDAVAEKQEAAGIAPNDQLVGRLLTPTVVARQRHDDTYVAEAVVWMEGLGGPEENPYGASMATAQLLVLTVSGAEGRRTVEDRIGRDVRYTVWTDPRDEIPLLTVATEGRDASDVVAAFDQIAAVMELELDGRQARAQIPQPRRAFVDVLSRPEQATDQRPAVDAAVLLVGLSGLAVAGGAGSLARRRSSSRTPPTAPSERLPALPTTWWSGAERVMGPATDRSASLHSASGWSGGQGHGARGAPDPRGG